MCKSKLTQRALHFQVQKCKKHKVFVLYAPLYNKESGFWTSLLFSGIAALTLHELKGWEETVDMAV